MLRQFIRTFTGICLLGVLIVPVRASEADALAVDAVIQSRHLPFGTILDPIYDKVNTNQIIAYTRCGDSALWTGAYLAAEAFRYKVTQSPEALANVKSALAGLNGLVAVTGDNRLSRCMFPANSQYAARIETEESGNTIHQAPPYVWVDNTSRDEVVGAFFGLGVAFDMVDDASVKSNISSLATYMIGFIAGHNWTPNDDRSNSFEVRPEELQMLLQVARHVNPANTVSGPFIVLPVNVGPLFDVQSNDSYFKFNLDYMTFYNLIRYQDNSDNRGAYKIVRNYTASHQNAFFDIIDRALNGADATRDAEMQNLLQQWLDRSRRDQSVDLTNTVKVCGSEACQPVPVLLRPPTDFLWQRDPFQLTGGGSGVIEGAGIDYILPYWMGRYYGVISDSTVQSAAAPSLSVAPNSLASLYGSNLASTTAQASTLPLPTSLGGVSLVVTDSANTPRNAPLLYVSATQINFIVPNGSVAGAARFNVTGGPAVPLITGKISATAPTLFSMNGMGTGVAAATAIQTQVTTPQVQAPIPVFQCTGSTCVAVPILLGVDTPIYLTLYGTGIQNFTSLANVQVTINNINVPVLFAGPAPGFVGLDQVNVSLPLTLRGSGPSNVVVTVDGQNSNAVMIDVR